MEKLEPRGVDVKRDPIKKVNIVRSQIVECSHETRNVYQRDAV